MPGLFGEEEAEKGRSPKFHPRGSQGPSAPGEKISLVRSRDASPTHIGNQAFRRVQAVHVGFGNLKPKPTLDHEVY